MDTIVQPVNALSIASVTLNKNTVIFYTLKLLTQEKTHREVKKKQTTDSA